VAGGDAEHARAAGADEQRQRGLDRLGIAGGVGDVVVGAVERGGLLREHRANDLDRLLEPAHSLARRLEFDAVGVMLVDLPARAEAEDHPATGEPVNRGSALREQRRVVHRGGRDKGPDPDPFGDRREGRQESPALIGVAARWGGVAGIRHVVVGQPDAMPASVVSHADLLQEVGGRAVDVRPEREFHKSTLEG
jgi:hypothetical protein